MYGISSKADSRRAGRVDDGVIAMLKIVLPLLFLSLPCTASAQVENLDNDDQRILYTLGVTLMKDLDLLATPLEQLAMIDDASSMVRLATIWTIH